MKSKRILVVAFGVVFACGCHRPAPIVAQVGPPLVPSKLLPNNCKPGWLLKEVIAGLPGITPTKLIELVPAEDPATGWTYFEICALDLNAPGVTIPDASVIVDAAAADGNNHVPASQLLRVNKPRHSDVPDSATTKPQ
jgi:hypothetical protein